MVNLAQRRLRYAFKRDQHSQFDIDMSDTCKLCQILVDLLNYDDSNLRVRCAELLFDIHSIEEIFLNDAEGSYLTTHQSNSDIYLEIISVGTMSDKDQLLGKMLMRQVPDVQRLLDTLKRFSAWCISGDDESEPNVSNQGVAYSSGQ